MRRHRRKAGVIVGFVALLTFGVACAPPPIASEGYTLVFADEFDTFNTSVWSTHQPWYEPPPEGAITVADGILTLRSNRANGYAKPNVTSLGPRTGTQYPHYPNATTFEEGYFEVRMRFTDSAHSRPTFWMLGEEWAQRWPESSCPTLQGELDIFEPLMLPTNEYHFGQHRNPGARCDAEHDIEDMRQTLDVELSTWHVYGGKWEDGQLCGYVDHVEIGCVDTFDTTAQPMYLILSQSAECDSWRRDLCAEAKPAELVTEVDWVRVWQRSG